MPLKLECFAVNDVGSRDKIGYLLLPLRSAQIIPRGKEVEAKVGWHKLLGVKPELRVSGPELLLSLTIEERDNIGSGSVSSGVEVILRSQRPEHWSLMKQPLFMFQTKAESQSEAAPSPVGATPRLLHEERLIQLGPDSTCRDLFLLSITAGRAENLELLVQRESRDIKEEFSFWYQILDNDIQLKSFRNISPVKFHVLNEKIVIRIRSSLNVLRNYFQKNPYLLVKLQHANVLAGQSKIDIRSLIPSDNAADFFNDSNDTSMALDQKCYLAMDNDAETIGGSESIENTFDRPWKY